MAQSLAEFTPNSDAGVGVNRHSPQPHRRPSQPPATTPAGSPTRLTFSTCTPTFVSKVTPCLWVHLLGSASPPVLLLDVFSRSVKIFIVSLCARYHPRAAPAAIVSPGERHLHRGSTSPPTSTWPFSEVVQCSPYGSPAY